MATATSEPFVTVTKAGNGPAPKSAAFTMRTPSGHAEAVVSGDALKRQAQAWSDYGCIEPSASASLSSLASLPSASSLVKDKVFVLLGATSSLGPFEPLARMGAKIACVARKGKKLERLVEEVREGGSRWRMRTGGG